MYDKHFAYQNLTYFRSKSKSFESCKYIDIFLKGVFENYFFK